jgi:predicted lactoylglutathione lyase
MTRMIFVNFPVSDLPRAIKFYEAIGFTNNPRFTDDSAAGMVLTDVIHVMLLTHERWQGFTQRPMVPAGSSEVSLALSYDSRVEIDQLLDVVSANGGAADVNPKQDHGFMYSRSFTDPDGHVWEPMWMDPAVASGEAEVPEITS